MHTDDDSTCKGTAHDLPEDNALRDIDEEELARHTDRCCPACGQTYDREEGEIPSAPGYLLDHCPACAEEIERRAVREANRRVN